MDSLRCLHTVYQAGFRYGANIFPHSRRKREIINQWVQCLTCLTLSPAFNPRESQCGKAPEDPILVLKSLLQRWDRSDCQRSEGREALNSLAPYSRIFVTDQRYESRNSTSLCFISGLSDQTDDGEPTGSTRHNR